MRIRAKGIARENLLGQPKARAARRRNKNRSDIVVTTAGIRDGTLIDFRWVIPAASLARATDDGRPPMLPPTSGSPRAARREASLPIVTARIVAFCACLSLATPNALAQETARDIDIPPQALGSALHELSRQTGLQPVYTDASVRGVTTGGVSGRMSRAEALERLLEGTKLGFAFTGPSSVAIRPGLSNGRSAADDAVALPTIDVDAARKGYGGAGPAQDPYNTSYELKDAATGTKTDTPIMDTPLNVQVIPQQVLRDQQAITVGEALRNVSGVTVPPGIATGGDGRGNSIIIRGFRASVFYRDGFRVAADGLSQDIVSTRQLANIASIEVLKGPAAVLYGLSEPGGIVNLVTKEPLNAPYLSVQQQIGSLALYRTTVDASGPITDDKAWLYRINLSYENNGAPFGRFVDFTSSQNIFVAPVVKWNLDPATWVKLEAEYSDDRSSLFFPFTGLYNGSFVAQPRNRNYGERSPVRLDSLFAALTWSHHFDKDWSIKQQIAYNRGTLYRQFVLPNRLVTTDAGPSVVRFNGTLWTTPTTYSTNVDITGHVDTFGALHTLLLGGDIYRITRPFASTGTFDSSIIGFWNPVHPGVPFGGFDIPFASDSTQNTAGLYLQDQIELPYHFFLLAGARYQYIRQESASGIAPDTLLPDGRPLIGQALTPRFGLLWRPQDWVSLYGNYTEGFGPNFGTIFPGILAPPSNARSWEAGVKLEFFDGRLRATADYYDLTKTNVPTTDPLHPFFLAVTGEARSKGVELDIQGEILPGWNVIASYTNQDVRITEDNDPIKVGQRLGSVPRNLASLWTTYEFQDETLKGLRIGAGYTYSGSQPLLDGVNRPGTLPLLPSYGLVDLMAAYSFRFADSKVTAQVNVTNLFNKTYYSGGNWNTPVGTEFQVAPGLQGDGYLAYGTPFAVLGSIRAEF